MNSRNKHVFSVLYDDLIKLFSYAYVCDTYILSYDYD